MLAAPGQGERDQRAVEQRLGQMRVQVRHGRRERRDVVRQPVVGVLDPAVHVAHSVVSLVLEVQPVRVVHQPGPVNEQKTDLSIFVLFLTPKPLRKSVVSPRSFEQFFWKPTEERKV